MHDLAKSVVVNNQDSGGTPGTAKRVDDLLYPVVKKRHGFKTGHTHRAVLMVDIV
ncbi:MAG TPA: hypothetical protein VFE27_25610 [Acidobacteriaceae bacterium]|nr:hypothetical protein [Acidobacteriaceae bacterium]